jgi:hypothetical protein
MFDSVGGEMEIGCAEVVAELLAPALESFGPIADARAVLEDAGPTSPTTALVVYLALAATLCDVFVDERTPQELSQAEDTANERSFDPLAAVRQMLGTSPHTAWQRLTSYRRAWNLPKLPSPTPGWDSGQLP